MRREAFADGKLVDQAEELRRRLQGLIAKLGDKETDPELQANVDGLAEILSKDIVNKPLILDTIVVCVTELAHKPHVYASLIANLSVRDATFSSEFGQRCSAAFQSRLKVVDWHAVNTLIRFWGEGVRQRFVSLDSFLALLKAFTAQALELLETYPMFADGYIDAVVWALSWNAATVFERDAGALEQLEANIDAYFSQRRTPTETFERSRVFTGGLENEDELLGYWIAVKSLKETLYVNDLCIVLPVVAEMGGIDEYNIPEPIFPLAHSCSPKEFRSRFHLFDDSNLQLKSAEFVIPAPCSHARLATRRLVNILLHFFEESPREGARVLGEIVFGTSRVHASMIVVEQILAQMLALPRPEHSAVYYESLMVSLCKNVKMIPPFMAKGVHILLERSQGYGVDVEAMLRLAAYFAFHLSNFDFKWAWTQWEVYVAMPKYDLRRLFVTEVVARLIRLSFLERLKELNFPETYNVLIPDKIESEFSYESDQTALQILDAVKASEAITILLERLYPAPADDPERDAKFELRLNVLIQCMLECGKATISHTLSVLEKYLTSLREQCTNGGAAARRGVLAGSASFYRTHPLMRTLFLQKLAFYKVVGPQDVAEHVERVVCGVAANGRADEIGLAGGDVWEVLDAACGLGRTKAEILEHKSKVESSEEKQRAFRANAVEEGKQGRVAARRVAEATKARSKIAAEQGEELEALFWERIGTALERRHL